jgi:peptidoglycan-associated lipoprotein
VGCIRGRTPEPVVVGPSDSASSWIIFFKARQDVGEAKARALLDDARGVLRAVAATAKSSARRVVLTGHTDTRGDEGANETLGQKRADAARQYLIARGVPESRITARSEGERNLICPGDDSDDCRSKNNNVVVELE